MPTFVLLTIANLHEIESHVNIANHLVVHSCKRTCLQLQICLSQINSFLPPSHMSIYTHTNISIKLLCPWIDKMWLSSRFIPNWHSSKQESKWRLLNCCIQYIHFILIFHWLLTILFLNERYLYHQTSDQSADMTMKIIDESTKVWYPPIILCKNDWCQVKNCSCISYKFYCWSHECVYDGEIWKRIMYWALWVGFCIFGFGWIGWWGRWFIVLVKQRNSKSSLVLESINEKEKTKEEVSTAIRFFLDIKYWLTTLKESLENWKETKIHHRKCWLSLVQRVAL